MALRPRYRPLLLALILLLIAASRAFRLDATVTEVTIDEVWSVWQGLGNPTQIIQWTPYDWTPGYYLTLGAWRAFTGLHPVALRWLSLLAFVVGSAALYRAARRLRGDGIIPMLAYAAFGYMIFMSTELRGYALLLALYPLSIWLALRYFALPRPARALPLALTMAAMVYVSMTSIPALGALALLTLIVYPRSVWRWWLPAGFAILLTLPELVRKFSVAVIRTQATSSTILNPFVDAVADMFRIWTINAPVVWLALIVLAVVLLARSPRRTGIALLTWTLLPTFLYISNPILGFFNVRYAWWVMVGMALLLGVGLAALPRLGRWAVAAVFGVLMLLPIPLNQYQIPQPPLGTAFDWLRGKARPGDVVLIDPNCGCGAPEVFDYYSRVYFPAGLPFVTQADDYRRIWYVTGAAGGTLDARDQVSDGRVAGIFVGPPEGLFRLYEAPPDPTGIRFDNNMRFLGIDRLDETGMPTESLPVYHEGDALRVRLWWSVDAPPSLDYSVGLFLLDETGNVIAQDDSAPNVTDAPSATSQWQPGQLYVEERALRIPYPQTRGRYRLMLALYWFGDQQRIAAPGVDENTLLPLMDVNVLAWPH